MTTSEKAEVLGSLKNFNWLMDQLGLSHASLRGRRRGSLKWKESEIKVVDVLYDKAEEALSMQRQANNLERQAQNIINKL